MLPEKIIILENVISKQHQDDIEQILLSDTFHWFYLPQSTYQEGIPNWIKKNKNIIEAFQLSHIFYTDRRQNSDAFSVLVPLLSSFPFNIDNLVRVKANMTTYHPDATSKTYGVPHVDDPIPGLISAVYYVNDSSGDTFIFNETKKDYLETGTLTVKKRITPKKGTLVVFDGSLLHSKNYPNTVNPRTVINFCFVPFRRLYN